MTTASPDHRPRPREVTFGGTQAVVGGAIALIVLIGAAQQLYSHEMEDVLRQALDDPRARELRISLDTARTMAKIGIMVMGVLSATSLILGVYVLKRHRGSRIVLTVLGALVAFAALFAGPTGWVAAAYIGGSVATLWSKAARAWFANPSGPGPGYGGGQPPTFSGGPPPPPPPDHG
jgi:hypothetical protein